MERTLEIVTVESVAFGGQGVARAASGRVLFVRGGLPGDRVEVEVGRGRRRHAEARVRRLVEASPERVPARCAHQSVCGGCPLQTLAYPAQLREKQAMVTEAWKRIGGLAVARVDPILPAQRIFEYRNKMEFGFSDQAWVEAHDPDAPADFGLGQHVPGVYSKVFDLHECHLQSPWTARILAEIRAFVREEGGGAGSVWNTKTASGFWRFVVLRESRATGERLLNLVVSRAGDARPAALAARLQERLPGVLSGLVSTVSAGSGMVATGEQDQVLLGDGLWRERLGDLTFELAPQAFFQTNTEQAEHLFQLVEDHLDGEPAQVLLDLYCGSGAIALRLAHRARRVVGVEIVPEAVVAARRQAELNGLAHRVEFHVGDVGALLKAGTLPRPDVVVVDPPRGGLAAGVVERLLELAPRHLVYVSCNPATQARDAALLAAGGYQALRLSPVDMFPHTFHVESVASFKRVDP